VDQRLSLVTLAVRDLDATRAFYVDGLGWSPFLEEPGDVIMFKVADKVILSLWVRDHFENEVGPIAMTTGIAPITLAHNVASREQVDEVLTTAQRAGADTVQHAEEREWGGYTGYFGDPDGYRWEVAFAPGNIGQEVLP